MATWPEQTLAVYEKYGRKSWVSLKLLSYVLFSHNIPTRHQSTPSGVATTFKTDYRYWVCLVRTESSIVDVQQMIILIRT